MNDDQPLTRQDQENLKAELSHYKRKAIELDHIVFSLRALLQSGKGFSEIMKLGELLNAFMAVCREHCGAQTSTMLMQDDLDPRGVFYRVRAYHAVDDTYIAQDGVREELLMFRFPQDQGLLWQLIQQGEVFSVRDIAGEPRFRSAWRKWNLTVLRSDVWCPLIMGGKVLGVLTLGDPDDGTIPESEYTFLQEMASVAATNIDSTLKYEKNERILNNLKTLYNVNQQLANVNDFKRLTIETLETAVQAMGAQKANLMLLNPETKRLEIKVVCGDIPPAVADAINEGRMETRSFAIGEGVAGRAAKERRPVRQNHRSEIEQVGKHTVHCILSVPLLYGGEVMGVMTMTNKVARPAHTDSFSNLTPFRPAKYQLDPLARFSETDEQLGMGLADQAAVNLHKARLYDASITDRLTGLKNKRHFEDQLDTLASDVACGRINGFTLVVTDIDHFKQFNDTHGHRAGDFVLAETARMLQDSARRTDGAFRYGGEEFCLLMPDADVHEAGQLLEGWRRRVEDHEFTYEGTILRVKVSIGICHFGTKILDTTELFELADQALYTAKHNGRNQVRVHQEGGAIPLHELTATPPSDEVQAQLNPSTIH